MEVRDSAWGPASASTGRRRARRPSWEANAPRNSGPCGARARRLANLGGICVRQPNTASCPLAKGRPGLPMAWPANRHVSARARSTLQPARGLIPGLDHRTLLPPSPGHPHALRAPLAHPPSHLRHRPPHPLVQGPDPDPRRRARHQGPLQPGEERQLLPRAPRRRTPLPLDLDITGHQHASAFRSRSGRGTAQEGRS